MNPAVIAQLRDTLAACKVELRANYALADKLETERERSLYRSVMHGLLAQQSLAMLVLVACGEEIA